MELPFDFFSTGLICCTSENVFSFEGIIDDCDDAVIISGLTYLWNRTDIKLRH